MGRWITGISLSLVLMMSCTANVARAATHTVCASGCQYTTIQAAIKAAAPGDTIDIRAGTYREYLKITKNLKLIGARHADGSPATILRQAQSASSPALTVDGGVNATVKSFDISNNQGETGSPAAIANNGTLTFEDGKIANNQGFSAPVVYTTGTLHVLRSTISGNRYNATSVNKTYGGAIIMRGGTVTISNSTLIDNVADYGGAIAATNGGDLTLKHDTFSNNRARLGAAVSMEDGRITVEGTTFTDSNSTAVFLSGGTVATVTHSLFSGNRGSGILAGHGSWGRATLTVSDSTFTGNTIGDMCSGGGGISVRIGTATITRDVFTNNHVGDLTAHSHGTGGAIAAGGLSGCDNGGSATVTISHSTFNGNRAGAYGGALSAAHATVHITDSTFSHNSAHTLGGAIADMDETSGSATRVNLNRVALTGNSVADGRGGAIYNEGVSASESGAVLTVVNSTITGNSAHIGGGIDNLQTGIVTVSASTIAHNTGGRGVANEESSQSNPTRPGAFALNSDVVAGNVGGDCLGVITTSVGRNLIQHHSGCTLKSAGGGIMPHTITGQDPLLGALAANGGAVHSMALKSGSPAINHGDPGTCTGAAGGIDSRDRSRNVAARGNKCDAGAYDTGG